MGPLDYDTLFICGLGPTRLFVLILMTFKKQ